MNITAFLLYYFLDMLADGLPFFYGNPYTGRKIKKELKNFAVLGRRGWKKVFIKYF